MPSRLNELMVKELAGRFSGVDTCVFLDFTGLNGRKASDLRDQLRTACGSAAKLLVVKATLAQRALETAGTVSDANVLRAGGPTAVACGADDPVLLVRTLSDWIRKPGNAGTLRFKGGVLAGRPLSASSVVELAAIPPRPVLMGQVVGAIAAPIASMLGLGQGLLRQIVGLADALAKQKSQVASN